MMSFRRFAVASAFISILSCAGFCTQQSPDNSQQNSQPQTTADNQSNAKSDRQLTAKARRAIIADKDLSTYAHNVKIVAMNGHITLKGPVRSEDEKQKVVADVAAVAGADNVENQLTVKQ